LHPLPFSGGPFYEILFWATYALWLVLENITARAKRSADPTRARESRLLQTPFASLLACARTGLRPPLSPPASNHLVASNFALLHRHRSHACRHCLSLLRHVHLRTLFSYQVEVHAGQTVVEAGPYRYIRHPSYTGAIVTSTDFHNSFEFHPSRKPFPSANLNPTVSTLPRPFE
jgi:protein-S-isoprenylcysteine O-methyltransferase